MFESSLRTYLIAQPAISALIGTRFYPMYLPQGGTLPAITYQAITGSEGNTYEGASGLAQARIQFDLWATTKAQTLALAKALRDALATVTAGWMGAERINDMDAPEPEVSIWHRIVEYRFWYDAA
jgi:hypothetical protein